MRPVRSAETRYKVWLRSLLRQVYARLRERLHSRLPDLTSRVRSDTAPQHPARRASALISGVRAQAERAVERERVERRLTPLVSHIRDANESDLSDHITLSSREITKGIQPLVDQWMAEQVRLIRDVPMEFLDRVERLTHDTFAEGGRHEDLAARIREEYDIADRRAQLIARTGVSQLTAKVNRTRQENAGVEQVVWRTMRDERTRPAHRERDGLVYDMDDPPGDPDDPGEGGWPEDCINCRCYLEPVITEEDENEED